MIPGVLTLRFTTNSGGAFSIGQSAPWFFVGVSAVVAVIILATAFRHTSLLVGVSLGLVLGGALGNLTDRAIRAPGMRGRVVDFIDFHVWPVFNLADTAIVVGAILLAWSGCGNEAEPEPTQAPRRPRGETHPRGGGRPARRGRGPAHGRGTSRRPTSDRGRDGVGRRRAARASPSASTEASA